MVLVQANVGNNGGERGQQAMKTSLLAGYSQYERPSVGSQSASESAACTVFPAADLVIASFSMDHFGVDQKALSVTLEGTLVVTWQDPRLVFNASCGVNIINFDDTEQLWRPSIAFFDTAKIEFPDTNNGLAESVWVTTDGWVIWRRQTRVSSRCKMHFGSEMLEAETQTKGQRNALPWVELLRNLAGVRHSIRYAAVQGATWKLLSVCE